MAAGAGAGGEVANTSWRNDKPKILATSHSFEQLMDVFQEYKPIRNKISLLGIEDALAVIWAYSQYLQMPNFRFPQEIEVEQQFLKLDTPQKWIAEWELEVLAKETILNASSVAKKDSTLRKWKTLSEILNPLKDLEGRIYKAFGSSENILVELIRVAHKQFIWQGDPPNSASLVRYFKIFNRPAIDEICLERIGLNVRQIYLCGTAWIGHFLDRPAINIPFKSDIKTLSVETIEKFLTFTCRPLREIRNKLKTEQRYDETFAYAYSSLRAFPLIKMSYQGGESIVCPLITLLYWRFTRGLYYELISDARFGNEFGDGFQSYVGEVIGRAVTNETIEQLPEQEYAVGKINKRSVDWIIADDQAALFIECKSKRMSWEAKASLTDLTPLEADIESMATAIVQVYKTAADYIANAYGHFPYEKDRKIFPAIVTLENWHMFGPVMLGKLSEIVPKKLAAEGLPANLAEAMPYSVWGIEDLEVGLQVINSSSLRDFMEGKLNDPEMRGWGWHAYMTKTYPKAFPAKRLFDKDYDEIFSELYVAQRSK